MKRGGSVATAALLLTAGIVFPQQVALADFELAAPNGRRVLLKDDGTWAYVEAKEKVADAKDQKDKKDSKDSKDNKDSKDKKEKKDEGDLILRLDRKSEVGKNCRFSMELVNNKPYEIRSLVLYFSAYRANGVLYATESTGSQFGSLRPGNSQRRQVEFSGIACQDIQRVQVTGGDRCTMGELHRWADQAEFKGQCLAQVNIVQSDIVKFDK